MVDPRALLEVIASDLLDGGNEQLEHPVGWNTPEAQRVRRQGRHMIRAAEVINAALTSRSQYQLAS